VEARSSLLESIELLSDDSLALRLQLTGACAGIEQLLGRQEEAHARLLGVLEALDEPASLQAGALMINLALNAHFRQEYGESREWGARALEVAKSLEDRPLTASASASVALACAFAEVMDEAAVHCTAAAALIDAMPDAELAVRLEAMAFLSAAEVYLDRFDESTAHGERGLSVARATGQGELLPMLTMALATVLSVSGRLRESADLLDGGIEGARLAGNSGILAWSLLNRSFAAVQLGELEIAVATAEESVELTHQFDDRFVTTYAGIILAIARLESGHPAQGAELFVSSGGGPGLPLVPGGWRAKYLELLTRCWLAVGRREEAESATAYARETAETTGLGMARAWAERAAAALALDAGEPAAAAERALASAAAADEARAPVEAAVARILAGRALAELGELDRATAELEGAAAVLEACGAFRYRQEADRELRKLGRPLHRRTRPGKADGTGVDSLTGRELELARLVVDRRTNPEIAAALFLSQKTVETHLRNMFRKLGVSSRAELARAVEQAERAQQG
jgi:ATP/maltotriose-dependent transcriptional regulator MalT